MLDDAFYAYYNLGQEQERLASTGAGTLEWARTIELLERYLPPASARVLDVGGGPGAYAAWLAARGYDVHLIDPVPLHVEQATATAAAGSAPFTAAQGDARVLDAPDASADAVLLLGPLYHLTAREDRLQALREARRVLRPGGVVLAVSISRFASLLDGLLYGDLSDPDFAAIVAQDLQDGQHRNPAPADTPEWFTTTFFHLPPELEGEMREAGLTLDALLGVEGPGKYIGAGWSDPAARPRILAAARAVEAEPSLLGLSAHVMAVGRKGRRAAALGEDALAGA
ncbi:MAG: methyltransferase domain-containing protein [Thermomicrobiales bacterium]